MASFSITGTECNSFLTKLQADLGTSPLIKIYSGTKPTVADTAQSGNTLLATLTCAGTPFSGIATNASSNAVATFGTITSATAAATGTATFFDLTTPAGTVIARGDVGTSLTSLILNTVSITSGSTVAITSATITMPVGN
jgi:hypothetical protein